MPVARYFVVVGSALVVLLLIAGWALPEPPASFPDRPEIIERAAIRIRSARTWPERVVLDTSQPAIQPSSIEVAPAQQQVVEGLPGGMADQTNVKSPAKPKPDARPIDAHHPPARARRRTARATPSTRVAGWRNPNELVTLETGEECCRSERTDRRAMSIAASRKRVAHRNSQIGWRFPEAD